MSLFTNNYSIKYFGKTDSAYEPLEPMKVPRQSDEQRSIGLLIQITLYKNRLNSIENKNCRPLKL